MDFLKNNEPTKLWFGLALCNAIVFSIIGCSLAKTANATDDDFMFCYAKVRDEKAMYISTIFIGDYLYDSYSTKREFYKFLKDTGSSVRSYSVSCSYESTYDEARIELQYKALQQQRYPYDGWNVVDTDWVPGYAESLPPPDRNIPISPENGGDGCYFGECPDDVSSSHRSVCSTLKGWCETLDNLPVGKHCYCVDSYGLDVEGITIPRP